jgi:hypothetical protein
MIIKFADNAAAYCAANMADPFATMGITNVSIGAINNNTSSNWSVATANTGYIDNTGMSTGSMPRGSATSMSYTITTPGFQSFTAGVFFDWNSNGVFTDAGEAVQSTNQSSPAATTFVFSFNVTPPVGAIIGATRFRIVYYYGTTVAALSCPPQTTQVGESMDYTANIASGLPIELLSFDLNIKTNNLVIIQWVTGSEANNDLFSIERATDARHFSTIGRVPGAGNSLGRLSYSIVDVLPDTGWFYYRLKQIDFNGNATYSSIRQIANRVEKRCSFFLKNGNLVYKQDSVFDQYHAELFVYDTCGQLVFNKDLKGNFQERIVMDASELASFTGLSLISIQGIYHQCIAKIINH